MALPLVLLALSACGNDTDLKRHNEPPTVVISAPADGETFRQGTGLVVLTGQASDTYDQADALAVTLTVGDDAPVDLTPSPGGEVSADVDIDDRPLGPLTLTLIATDSDGETGAASVTIEIGGPLGPPTVWITEPADGATYTVGDSVAMRGEATDETTPPDDLSFAWSSSLDGDLPGEVSSGGASAVFVDGLSAGTHTITLTVTDGDGETASDSVDIVVEEEVVVPEPGDLVFSEFMVNPEAVEDEVGEWVELYNTSGSTLDVTGYTFRDDDVDAWVLEGPLSVASHDYLVLCAEMDPTLNGGVPCDGWFFRDSTGGGMALANGPDEVVLARPDGVEIDWLHYDDTWYTIGAALGLDPDELTSGANDDLSHWCTAVTITAPMTEPGTPGAQNDDCDGL